MSGKRYAATDSGMMSVDSRAVVSRGPADDSDGSTTT
jgi:hypothetical protein